MTEARTIDEAYSSATNASNLRVEADRRGDADIMIAAGWSQSRIGAALLRLHSEWDGAEHLPKMTSKAIEALAATTLTKDGKPDFVAAHNQAEKWHINELMLLRLKLKTLPAVRHQLCMQAEKWGVESPQDVAGAVLLWWLDRVCGVCRGVKFELVPGTNSKSSKVCQSCRSSGEKRLPYGDAGRKLDAYIEDCLMAARQSMKKRLRFFSNGG